MDFNVILLAAAILGAIGLISAVILFFISKAFKVEEDPLIDEVAEKLPGANCGGCGYPGCRGFAEAIVKGGSLEGFNCPAGGGETMTNIAEVMGLTPVESDPIIAVLRCNGSCEHAPAKSLYDSALSCAYASTLFSGESGCQYGCLGCGDCVSVCKFDAIFMNPETKLPDVVEDKCVGCGACVKACPRTLLEIRNKGKKGRRIFVACSNQEKGAVAKKNCAVACIGCGKCAKVCAFEAITITNYLAYIDYTKCKLCRKCAPECPTNAIHEINFPPKKVEKPVEEVTEIAN
ncbi:MAG: ferredoxin [Bacteroidetes bacterium HGW-Bacteroidetes-19]|nr:MAG: ferredoxin [Bacteroidetes bacterium HGW-Bacteroidetes-19]